MVKPVMVIRRPACSNEANIGFPNLSKYPCEAFSDVFALIVATGSLLQQSLEERQLLHDLHTVLLFTQQTQPPMVQATAMQQCRFGGPKFVFSQRERKLWRGIMRMGLQGSALRAR